MFQKPYKKLEIAFHQISILDILMEYSSPCLVYYLYSYYNKLCLKNCTLVHSNVG